MAVPAEQAVEILAKRLVGRRIVAVELRHCEWVSVSSDTVRCEAGEIVIRLDDGAKLTVFGDEMVYAVLGDE